MMISLDGHTNPLLTLLTMLTLLLVGLAMLVVVIRKRPLRPSAHTANCGIYDAVRAHTRAYKPHRQSVQVTAHLPPAASEVRTCQNLTHPAAFPDRDARTRARYITRISRPGNGLPARSGGCLLRRVSGRRVAGSAKTYNPTHKC